MDEKFLLDVSIEKIYYSLKWTGLNLEKKDKWYQKYHLYFIFMFIWVNLDVLGALCWFVQGLLDGESLTSFTYVTPCVTMTSLADIKSLSFIFYQDKIHGLIAKLKELELAERGRERSNEKEKIIKEETELLHRVLKLLNIFNWSLMIAFPCMPLVLIVLDYIKTKKISLLLPLLIWFPFDEFNIRVWPFVFLNEVWAIVIVVLEVCGMDYIFIICTTYIRIQFRLLSHEIESLISSDRLVTLYNDQSFRERFKDIVKWNQELIHSVEILEIIYSKSILYNFVSSSALICLCGFNVTSIDEVSVVISFASFLFTSLLQIFFLCFYGDMLITASTDLSDAVYRCKWYVADAKSAKMLMTILSRTQKPCKVTAAKFANVNLNSFTKILSTSYSYFALLRTLYTSK